jgi:hypothetical protein
MTVCGVVRNLKFHMLLSVFVDLALVAEKHHRAVSWMCTAVWKAIAVDVL